MSDDTLTQADELLQTARALWQANVGRQPSVSMQDCVAAVCAAYEPVAPRVDAHAPPDYREAVRKASKKRKS